MERRLACKNIGILFASAVLDYKSPSTSLDQDVNEFYAKSVVQTGTHDVDNPENALGKPDQKFAVIKPRGELTLEMKKPFSTMNLGGIAAIIGTGQNNDVDYTVAVLIPMEQRNGKIQYAWEWVPPSSVPGAVYAIQAGQTKVRQLKIKNNSQDKNLEIDYVAGH